MVCCDGGAPVSTCAPLWCTLLLLSVLVLKAGFMRGRLACLIGPAPSAPGVQVLGPWAWRLAVLRCSASLCLGSWPGSAPAQGCISPGGLALLLGQRPLFLILAQRAFPYPHHLLSIFLCDSHPNMCEMKSHCYFDSHFPDDL